MAKKKRISKGLSNPQAHVAVVSRVPDKVIVRRDVESENLQSETVIEPPPKPTVKVQPQAVRVEESSISNFWLVGGLAVMAGAVALRFLWLTLKPFHHDEGVNGFFLTGLFRDGVYKYDPSNYHGPSLYYFSLASSYIFGLNDFAVRFVTVVFGILTVALVFSLRRYLGTIGTLVAASLVALSPGLVFFSRYYIHEILLVYFCFAVAVGVLKYIEGERPGKGAIAAMSITLFVCFLPVALYAANSFVGKEQQVALFVARFIFVAAAIAAVYFAMRELLKWDAGRPMYLFLASAAAVMTFTTKETSFITLGTMLIAVGCLWVWFNFIADKIKSPNESTLREPIDLSLKTFKARLEQSQNSPALFFVCAALFVFLGIVFFSSFFTHEKGIGDAFEAYNIWTKTGTKDHAMNGTWAYLRWMLAIEAPLLILGAIGALIAFQKSKHRFAMFVALWAFGLFAAYSIIPYKTPWLAINFALPMALIAGYGINELANGKESLQRVAALIFMVFGVGICTYQTIDFNFFRYDDEAIPYVYVHSKRSMNEMVREIGRIGERAGTGKQTVVVVTAPENWPLPWTLHEYKRIGFHGTMYKEPTAEIVLGSSKQSAELEQNYSATHRYVETYTLRPGVDLMLYLRKDIRAD